MASIALSSRSTSIFSALRDLVSSSSLSSRNPFETFGPAAQARVADAIQRAPAQPRIQPFSVTEARNRIRALFDAALIASASSLDGLLKGNMMSLEAHVRGKGRPITYLVDRISQQRVLASAVDRRLGFRSLQQRFGFARTYPRPVTREEKLAANCRQSLIPIMPPKPDKSMFSDWNDLYYTLPVMLRGNSYVERNGVGYVGRVETLCPETRDELEELILKARTSGKRLIVPGNPVPGSPILDAAFSTRSELVHPSLKAERLKEQFGCTMGDHFERLENGRRAFTANLDRNNDVIDPAEFRRRFVRRADPEPKVEPKRRGYGFGGAFSERDLSPEVTAVRQYTSDRGREAFTIWNRETRTDVPIDLRFLPEGEYPKEDGYGLPSGYLVVKGDGSITHLNLRRQVHNELGASSIPAPGSDAPQVWAINGQVMSATEFKKAISSLREHGEDVSMTAAHAAVTDDDAQVSFAPGLNLRH